MSGEINITTSLSFVNGDLEDSFSHSQTTSMSVAGYNVQSPVIGTAVASISTANLSTVGYAYMRSLVDSTQSSSTITFGRLVGTSFVGQVVMRPNEQAVMRLAPGQYAAQAAGEGFRLLLATLEG